ncbi:MAG: tyrosine-type recombinase/integrase [bacterium]|nr:tyrosine-type recombinase/integrase [bacterium]
MVLWNALESSVGLGAQGNGLSWPRSVTRLNGSIRRAYKKAGLRKFGWHIFRHTFASHLVMRGVGLRQIQELMGHKTLEMTMRYAHLSQNALDDAVGLLDGTSGIEKTDPPLKLMDGSA